MKSENHLNFNYMGLLRKNGYQLTEFFCMLFC
jgi:hypothetical protein